MAEEKKRGTLMKSSEGNSDDDQYLEILQDHNSDNDVPSTSGVGSSSQEDSGHCDREESDVMIIDKIPEDMWSKFDFDESYKTTIVYKYPSDSDEDCCSRLPQTSSNNAENLSTPEEVKIVNLKDIHPPVNPEVASQIRRGKSDEEQYKKSWGKTALENVAVKPEGYPKAVPGTGKLEKAASDPQCGSSHKFDEFFFVPIREFTRPKPEAKHQNTVSNYLKHTVKCPDYNSDEFADVEDNLTSSIDSVISSDSTTKAKAPFLPFKPNHERKAEGKEAFETSDTERSVDSINDSVRSKAPNDKSRNKALSSSSSSCNGCVSHGKAKRIKAILPTVVNVPDVKNARRETMATILEESEDVSQRPKVSQPSVSKTNSLVMKTKVVKRKDKCNVCNAKLGLCAIKCRCGGYFCAKHRYDREHNCTFDYKAMGADEIRKNNPKVVAEKVRKL